MCVIYTFVLSVVLGSWGPFLGDHTVASWSWNLRAVSQAVPHKITPGDHAWLWESHCGERAWGYKLGAILVLMLEEELLPCTGCFALCCCKEALAETVPAGPAPVVLTKGRIPWERVS